MKVKLSTLIYSKSKILLPGSGEYACLFTATSPANSLPFAKCSHCEHFYRLPVRSDLEYYIIDTHIRSVMDEYTWENVHLWNVYIFYSK